MVVVPGSVVVVPPAVVVVVGAGRRGGRRRVVVVVVVVLTVAGRSWWCPAVVVVVAGGRRRRWSREEDRADPENRADVEHRAELELAGGAHRGQGPLAIGDPGQLHLDGAIADHGDLRLLHVAQRLDAPAHDLTAWSSIIGIGPLGRLEYHRESTLEVQAETRAWCR